MHYNCMVFLLTSFSQYFTKKPMIQNILFINCIKQNYSVKQLSWQRHIYTVINVEVFRWLYFMTGNLKFIRFKDSKGIFKIKIYTWKECLTE